MRVDIIVFFMMSLAAMLAALPAYAGSGPQTFSYEGRLYDANGDPSNATVSFKVQVLDNQATCVLYEESFVGKDLSTTRGLFSLELGTGNTTAGYMPSLQDALRNTVGANTIHGCSYGITDGDGRKVRIVVNDGSDNTLSPDLSIGAAAYAMSATELEGKRVTDFITVDTTKNITQTNFERVFAGTGFDTLKDLVDGKFLKASSSGVQLPSYAVDPTTSPPGSVWYDSINNVLKYKNGSAVVSVVNGVSSITAGDGLTGNTITTNGTIALQTIGTGGTGSVVTYDKHGRVTASAALSEADLPSITSPGKVAGSAITGTIGGSTSISTTGNIQTSGDLTARRLTLFENGTGTSYVALTAPTGVTSYSLRLPLNIGVNGQALTTDGVGNLLWSTPLSNVTGSAPLSNGSIWIGDSSGKAQAFPVTGDATLSNSGVLTLQTVPVNKGGTGLLAAGTSNQILGVKGDGSALEYKSLAAGTGVTIANTPGTLTISAAGTGGTVTSVGVSVPSYMTNTGPITSSGTIGLDFKPQAANTVFAGPVTGSAAPSFRTLGIADIKSTVTGNFFAASGACTAGQALTYSSVSDTISCAAYSLSSSQVTTALGYTPVNKAGDAMTGALTLPTNGLTVGTSDLVVVGGNVGVGSSNPTARLDVNGTVQFKNSLSTTGTSGTFYSFSILPFYNQPSGTAANTDLLINRTQTAVGSGQQNLIDAQVGGVSKFRVDNTGKIYGDGSGLTGLSGAISGLTSGKIPKAGSATTLVDSTITEAGGKIGLGTAVPTGLLDVRAGTAAAGVNGSDISIYAENAGSGNQGGGDIILMPGSKSGTGASGTVAIGTASPPVYLEPNSLYATGNLYSNGSVYASNSLLFADGSIGLTASGAAGSGSLAFKQNSATRMTLSPSGYIGIGTTTPVAPLDVRTVNTTGTNAYGTQSTLIHAPASSTAANAVASNASMIIAGSTAMPTTTVAANAGWVNQMNTADVGTVKGGDFGISNTANTGTISSAYGVSGSVSNDGIGTITNAYGLYSEIWRSAGTVGNGYGLYIGNITASNPYGVYVSSTTAKNYFGGKVGIGTANPFAQLDVNGQIKISGGSPGAGKVLTSDADGLATWTTPATGGLSSVGLTAPSEFTITGSPLTANGSITAAWTSQTQGKVFASPTGASGAPTFRSIATSDLPSISTGITGVLPVANGGTGASTLTSGSLIVGSGTTAVTTLAGGTTGNVLYATSPTGWSSATPDTAGLVAKSGAQTIAGVKTFSSQPVFNAGLQISTGAAANKVLTSDASGNATWQTPATAGIGGSGTNNYLAKFSGTNVIASSVISEVSSNIGIGVATGTERLDVNGNIKASGLKLNGSSLQTYSATTGSASTITGNSLNNGSLLSLSSSTVDILANNSVSGISIDLNGGSLVSNTTRYGVKSNTTGSGGSSTNVAGYFYADGGSKNFGLIVGAGDVGIGTESPSAKLDVAGQIKITGGTPGLGKVLTSDAAGLASWQTPIMSGGTVTNVTSANTDISVANGSSTPTLTLNSGTSANQIVKLDASAKLPAVDGSALTNLNTNNLSSIVPVSKGGTGASSLTSGSILIGNGTTAVTNLSGGATGNLLYATSATAWSSGTPDTAGVVAKTGAQTIAGVKTFSNQPVFSSGLQIPTGATAGKVLTSDAAGNAAWGPANGLGYTPVNKAGDTMTGALTVPSNGLTVGTSDLVVNSGKVGVGTSAPSTELDVAGTLKIANGSEVCSSAAQGGMLRYTLNRIEYCNGTSWTVLGTGLSSLGGLTNATQTFAIGTTGTSPQINSAGTVHTLNIPSASNSGVTAGTISKAEYDTFMNKQPAGNYLTTSASTNQIPKISGSATLGNSSISDDGSIVRMNGVSGVMAGTNDKLEVNGFIRSHGIRGREGVSGSGWGNVFNFSWDASLQAHLWVDSTDVGILYTGVSDRRLKREIEPLNSTFGLESITRLRPVSFHWKYEDPDKDKTLGFIAQEVEEVFPDLVEQSEMKTPDAPDGVNKINFYGLFAPIVKAIQELYERYVSDHNRINQLEQQNAELKSKLEAQDARLERLEKLLEAH